DATVAKLDKSPAMRNNPAWTTWRTSYTDYQKLITSWGTLDASTIKNLSAQQLAEYQKVWGKVLSGINVLAASQQKSAVKRAGGGAGTARSSASQLPSPVVPPTRVAVSARRG